MCFNCCVLTLAHAFALSSVQNYVKPCQIKSFKINLSIWSAAKCEYTCIHHEPSLQSYDDYSVQSKCRGKEMFGITKCIVDEYVESVKERHMACSHYHERCNDDGYCIPVNETRSHLCECGFAGYLCEGQHLVFNNKHRTFL